MNYNPRHPVTFGPFMALVHHVQERTALGWETVFETLDEKEARQVLADYRENMPNYSHRLVTKEDNNANL